MSNIFKDQVVLYGTRDDMERVSPDAVGTNATDTEFDESE
jgi:hypothetical protein